jgi:hypothetical protein
MVSLLLDYGLDVESTLLPGTGRPLHRALRRRRSRTKCDAHQAAVQTRREDQNAPGCGLFAATWYDDVGNLDPDKAESTK